MASELLTSVKKMEDSLKRLKAQRKSFAGMQSSSTGMSDDDKIRLQLALDIRFYGEQVSPLVLLFDSPPERIGKFQLCIS